ncbi:fungal-specific transcription factor domain-containing protein [Kalaharituber pfeilii]|nr:fungal-specific transcription factor domain-containing protein [Kalaharituber pfeilii]
MEASLTSPLLRVSRPVSACSRCRSAKVKCDGKLPACSACERSGKAHECTGGSDQFARGKERSYVASLESRIEKLEKRLAALNSRRGLLDSPTATPKLGSQTDDDDWLNTSSPLTRKQAKVEDDEMEDLVADLGYLQISACTRDFYGVTEKVSFCRLVLKTSASSKSLDDKPRARLPSRHTATQLIQHYFDKIYTLLPCFSETGFFGSLDSVYRDEASASAFDCYMVYMVLGVGTMSLSRSRDSAAAHNAACFVKTALEYAPAVITPANICGVQATLMLAQYSMLEPQHFNSWYLIGVASRILIDIGLHHEPQRVLKLKPAELELRRKIFYCVYSMDRSISMVLQRPFSFSDDAIDVQLPKAHDIQNPKTINLKGNLTPMAAAVHLFELRKHQSAWYQKLYHTGNEPSPDPKPDYFARREVLERWFSAMPEGISKPNKDWLALEWHYLYVYASAPCPKMPQPCKEALMAIFTHCAQYAIKFRQILADLNNRTVYTFHDALRPYYVGMNLLHALWHNEEVVLNENNIGTAMEGIKATTYVLGAMTGKWEDAERLRNQFRQDASFMMARLQQKVNEYLTAPSTRQQSIPQVTQSHVTPLPPSRPSPPPQQPLQLGLESQTLLPSRPSHSQAPCPVTLSTTLPAITTPVTLSSLPALSQPLLHPLPTIYQQTFDFPEWPEYSAALAALNGGRNALGVFNPSGHIATADFGNVAFYSYNERSWDETRAGMGMV